MKAYQSLVAHGWGQGTFYNEKTGKVCAYGAISSTYDEDEKIEQAGDRLEHYVRKTYHVKSVERWNDDSQQTEREVQRVLWYLHI